jgi:hypothetical protein
MTSAPCRRLRSNGRAKCAFSPMRTRLIHYCNGLETLETPEVRLWRWLNGCAQTDKADKPCRGAAHRRSRRTQNYVRIRALAVILMREKSSDEMRMQIASGYARSAPRARYPQVKPKLIDRDSRGGFADCERRRAARPAISDRQLWSLSGEITRPAVWPRL